MSANFRERQHERWASVSGSDAQKTTIADVHPTFKNTRADNPTAGGGNGGRDRFDERDPAGAEVGAQWAGRPSPDGTFRKTVGLMPAVEGHVKVFERSVNMSGGINQPGFYTSDAAPGVARANIQQYERKFDVQDQAAGRTFEDRQHERWNKVTAKVRKG